MNKPLLLDCFCGAGGTSRGYFDAGFDVIGVDNRPQPRYPYKFILADALEFLDTADLSSFSAIHASPPCQAYTVMLSNHLDQRARHPDLVDAVRKRLQLSGKPYVIENVPGAPIEKLLMLCGTMFGLKIYRHRFFESNMFFFEPFHPLHKTRTARAGRAPKNGEFHPIYGHFTGGAQNVQHILGIDWMMSREEVAQAIPPAYTRYIGQFLLDALEWSVA